MSDTPIRNENDVPMITAEAHFEELDLYRCALDEARKQRDALAKSFKLVWKHLKGERIRHDYIFETGKSGDLKTLQEVCEEALAAVEGGGR